MIKRLAAVFMGNAVVGIVAAILVTRFSGEDLFYKVFALAQGAAFGSLLYGFRCMGDKRIKEATATELRVCASFFLLIVSVLSLGYIDTDGFTRLEQWVPRCLGIAAGVFLREGSPLSSARQNPPLVKHRFLIARVSIVCLLASYVIWVAMASPMWWTEEHSRLIRQEYSAVLYHQHYRLSWDALGLLAAQALVLINNWTVRFPPPKTE